jgi:uncharacterized protein
MLALFCASPARAIDFPPLSGRVVDQADLLNPQQEAELTAKLEALQRATSRQLVVATVPSLHDLAIEDYGNQLGRAWRIGQAGANNGVVLIIAPNERKMRIEVGYGLEGIMTDALSSRIVRETITPRFRAGDYAGGINAGVDAIIAQLQAPPEAQERAALAAQQAANQSQAERRRGGGSSFPFFILIPLLFFIVIPLFGAGFAGRRYRRGVSIWGPGRGRGNSGLGWALMGMALGSMNRRGGGGGSWGGGGGSSWGGGGGFSGGGGSFGGGGASGGW